MRPESKEGGRLNEALNIDTATAQRDARPRSPQVSSRPSTVEESEAPDVPPSYNMTAPLNETELMSLLMASPLYQKLEKIKSQIEQGAHKGDGSKNMDSKFKFNMVDIIMMSIHVIFVLTVDLVYLGYI